MGAVWKGRLAGVHGFEKLVAVKTIAPALREHEGFRTMFLEEARVSSKVVHANVAQILDVGECDGVLYIVFEWVDGVSLESLCKREPPAAGPVLRMLADVCAGLHVAHELGVVHRDVSPHNILVGQAGFAKLIDFGIAKARDRLCAETKTGMVRGTPEYMSPEQASGAPVDRRADVWSMGAVLHRVLLGRPPLRDAREMAAFAGGNRTIEIPTSLPADVRQILARALARSRDERFATAAAMASALRAAAGVHAHEADAVAVAPSRTEEPTRPDRAEHRVDPRADTELAPAHVASGSRQMLAIERRRWSIALLVALVLAVASVATALVMAIGAPR